jgi:hypothetical protein
MGSSWNNFEDQTDNRIMQHNISAPKCMPCSNPWLTIRRYPRGPKWKDMKAYWQKLQSFNDLTSTETTNSPMAEGRVEILLWLMFRTVSEVRLRKSSFNASRLLWAKISFCNSAVCTIHYQQCYYIQQRILYVQIW